MKTFICTEIYTESDQKLLIQPTPDFTAIEIYTQDLELNSKQSCAFYISKKELPVIIEKLSEMMNYINKKEHNEPKRF